MYIEVYYCLCNEVLYVFVNVWILEVGFVGAQLCFSATLSGGPSPQLLITERCSMCITVSW